MFVYKDWSKIADSHVLLQALHNLESGAAVMLPDV